MQIAAGYEDANDCNALRDDELFSVLIAVFIQNCLKMAKIEPDLACFYQKLPRKNKNIVDSYEISGTL